MNTEEEIKKRGFEVIDKRGQNNPIQEKPKPVDQEVDTRPVKNRTWKSIGYWCVPTPMQDGTILLIGRAHGLADDGNIFQADYLVDQHWDSGRDWTIDAKRRLDTFLLCPCDMKTGPCQFHRRLTNGGWQKEDTSRIRENGDRPLPEVLEVLFRAERAKQQAQRIIAPRR